MFGKPTFGAPAPSTSFGSSSLFGQPSTGGGLFNTSSTFGQQNKPTTFGFGSTPQTGTFLGTQQPQPSSIFNTSGGSSLFGGTTGFGSQQTGTVVKFVPVTGNDTMMKNGTAQSISTKHHSITCMKEYEGKSFEELRMEDYQANRKGPQQGVTGFGVGAPTFGTTPSATPLFGQTDANKSAFGQPSAFGQGTAFGQQSTGFGSGFGAGATTTPSLFGSTDANKQSAFGQSAFGQTSTFGQPATGGFGMGTQQNTTGSPFGKPAFGTTTSSTGFGFGTTAPQNTNPFGAANATKSFGTGLQTQTQPGLFGSTASQANTGFGTGLFPSTQNTGSSLFNKPTQPTTGFGAAGQTTGFPFNPPASTQPSLFSNQSKPLFGGTSTTPVRRQKNVGISGIPSLVALDCFKVASDKAYELKLKTLDIKAKTLQLTEKKLDLEKQRLSIQEKLIDLHISDQKLKLESKHWKDVALKTENIMTSYEKKFANLNMDMIIFQEKLLSSLLSTEQKFVELMLSTMQK